MKRVLSSHSHDECSLYDCSVVSRRAHDDRVVHRRAEHTRCAAHLEDALRAVFGRPRGERGEVGGVPHTDAVRRAAGHGVRRNRKGDHRMTMRFY